MRSWKRWRNRGSQEQQLERLRRSKTCTFVGRFKESEVIVVSVQVLQNPNQYSETLKLQLTSKWNENNQNCSKNLWIYTGDIQVKCLPNTLCLFLCPRLFFSRYLMFLYELFCEAWACFYNPVCCWNLCHIWCIHENWNIVHSVTAEWCFSDASSTVVSCMVLCLLF